MEQESTCRLVISRRHERRARFQGRRGQIWNREAFEQIETQCYEEGIIEDGYAGVVSYGICFCKKGCIVGLYGS